MAKPRKDEKSELRPDGWERFGRAVDAAIKSGPKHRAPAHKPREEMGLKRKPNKKPSTKAKKRA